MLRTLKDLLEIVTAPAGPAPSDEHTLHLAAAVLLVEVMRAEPQATAQERLAVAQALRGKFDLAEDEAQRLVDLAEETARSANDFYRFTSELNDRFSHAQKVRMIEFMWSVAFADGQLDAHENHLISKMAGLLHVTHGEYIAAKLHAKQATGLGAP